MSQARAAELERVLRQAHALFATGRLSDLGTLLAAHGGRLSSSSFNGGAGGGSGAATPSAGRGSQGGASGTPSGLSPLSSSPVAGMVVMGSLVPQPLE